MLGKAGKAVAKPSTRAAQLEAENQPLKYRLDSIRVARIRKKVECNLNERFSNIESTKAAIDHAAALQAQ